MKKSLFTGLIAFAFIALATIPLFAANPTPVLLVNFGGTEEVTATSTDDSTKSDTWKPLSQNAIANGSTTTLTVGSYTVSAYFTGGGKMWAGKWGDTGDATYTFATGEFLTPDATTSYSSILTEMKNTLGLNAEVPESVYRSSDYSGNSGDRTSEITVSGLTAGTCYTLYVMTGISNTDRTPEFELVTYDSDTATPVINYAVHSSISYSKGTTSITSGTATYDMLVVRVHNLYPTDGTIKFKAVENRTGFNVLALAETDYVAPAAVITRELESESETWSTASEWPDEVVPSGTSSVELKVISETGSTLTLDADASVDALTISGDYALMFAGDKSLTAAATAVNTDVDVSGITASLGAVTIAEGKTLNVGAGFAGSVANGVNLGTINVANGTDENHAIITLGNVVHNDSGVIKVAENTSVRLHATGGNKIYTVTGAGQSSRVSLTSSQDWGISTSNDKSLISNCTLILPQYVEGTTANANLWVTPKYIGEGVHFVVGTGRQVTFENQTANFNIASLAGEGNFVNSGTYNINITDGADAEYAGVITGSHNLSKTGEGTQTLSGANTYSGTTTVSGGTLKLTGSGALGSGAVTVNESGCLVYNVDATPANTFTGAGTITADTKTLDLTSADLDGYTGGYSIVNDGVLILPAGAEGSVSEDETTTNSFVTVESGTLRLALSLEQLAAGYTAKVAEGTIVEFYNGVTKIEEGVDGNTYTCPTPVWKPQSAESTLSTDACWSTGTVPESGAVIIDTSAWTEELALSVSQTYSPITFVGNGEFITSVTFDSSVTKPSSITVGGLVAFAYDVVMSDAITFTLSDSDSFLIADVGSGDVTSAVNVADKWNFGKKGTGTLTFTAGFNGTNKLRIFEGTVKFNGQAMGNWQNAELTIDEGATLSVVNNNCNYNPVFGTGSIINNGTFVYSSTGDTNNCHLWGAISGTGIVKIEQGWFQLHNDNTYSGGTELSSGAVLVVTTAGLGSGPISGTGTVRMPGYPNETIRGYLQDSEKWMGRYVNTSDFNPADTGNWFGLCGNENSQVELSGTVTGYFKPGGSTDADFVVSGNVTMNDGYSSNGGYAFNGDLLGGGTFAATGDPSDVLKFLGETKDFAGSMMVTGSRCISFGEQSDDDSTKGQILIKSGYTGTIAADKGWSAVKGVVVDGVLGGAGTVSSAITFNAGSTLDVSSGAPLTVTGALTLAGKVTVKLPEKPEVGMSLLKYVTTTDLNSDVSIKMLEVGKYTLVEETADDVTTVKLGPKTGFMIIVR